MPESLPACRLHSTPRRLSGRRTLDGAEGWPRRTGRQREAGAMPRSPTNRRLVRAFAGIGAVMSFAASALAADEPSQRQILDALRAKRATRCPQVSCAAFEQRGIELEVSFAYGSAVLGPQAIAELAARGGELREQAPGQILVIRGHTDGQGGHAYN